MGETTKMARNFMEEVYSYTSLSNSSKLKELKIILFTMQMRHPTIIFNLDEQSYNHTLKATDAERQPNKEAVLNVIIPSG